jgi:hypothetical protein
MKRGEATAEADGRGDPVSGEEHEFASSLAE